MTLSVIVPYRPSNGHRRRSWEWCERRIRALLPDAELVIGTVGRGPFNKPVAVNDAVSRSTGQVLLILDADTAVPRPWLASAYEHALRGGWSLVDEVHYLNLQDTRRVLACPPTIDIPLPRHPEYSGGVSWGGAVMVPREAFNVVNGMDERFCGWGPEDIAFGLALTTCWCPSKRLPGDLMHLWHPPARRQWREGVQPLFTQYLDAVGNRDAMMSLIQRVGAA